MDEACQVRAADFLLAFNDKLEIARQFAIGGSHGVNGGQAADDMSLIITGAARVKLAIANRGLEWGAGPSFYRFGWLDIVVVVEKESFGAAAGCFGDDNRIAFRG